MARDRNAQLRNLIVGYGDSIRLSDIKANIAVLFVAIMMGTVLGFRANYPWYLKVPVLLAPFIVIFFCLLSSSIDAFPARAVGASRSGESTPEDFEFITDPVLEVEDLPARCALLSRLLYWKTVRSGRLPRSMATIVGAGVLMFVAWK